jgi:predicted acyltransferase (DUF342 family)
MAVENKTDVNGRSFTNGAQLNGSTYEILTNTDIDGTLDVGSNADITGTLDVGSNTEINGNLTVTGLIQAGGDLIAFQNLVPSDSRLKSDVTPLKDSLAKINQMQGVSYTFDPSGKKQIGLIAQDVEKIIPEVVSIQNDYYTMSYPNLVAVLIEAVKELSSKVEDLESRLDN